MKKIKKRNRIQKRKKIKTTELIKIISYKIHIRINNDETLNIK